VDAFPRFGEGVWPPMLSRRCPGPLPLLIAGVHDLSPSKSASVHHLQHDVPCSAPSRAPSWENPKILLHGCEVAQRGEGVTQPFMFLLSDHSGESVDVDNVID